MTLSLYLAYSSIYYANDFYLGNLFSNYSLSSLLWSSKSYNEVVLAMNSGFFLNMFFLLKYWLSAFLDESWDATSVVLFYFLNATFEMFTNLEASSKRSGYCLKKSMTISLFYCFWCSINGISCSLINVA